MSEIFVGIQNVGCCLIFFHTAHNEKLKNEKFIVSFFSVKYPYTHRLLIAFPVIAIESIIGKFSFTDNKLTTV